MEGSRGSWAAAHLARYLVLGLPACLDPLTAPVPVTRLVVGAESARVGRGETASVLVQAVDVNGSGVDGARVTFARGQRERIAFEGATDEADAITVTTKLDDTGGLSVPGAAIARVRAFANAELGETDVLAIVKEPTADPIAAITARIIVTIDDEGGERDGGNGEAEAAMSGSDATPMSGSFDGGAD